MTIRNNLALLCSLSIMLSVTWHYICFTPQSPLLSDKYRPKYFRNIRYDATYEIDNDIDSKLHRRQLLYCSTSVHHKKDKMENLQPNVSTVSTYGVRCERVKTWQSEDTNSWNEVLETSKMFLRNYTRFKKYGRTRRLAWMTELDRAHLSRNIV